MATRGYSPEAGRSSIPPGPLENSADLESEAELFQVINDDRLQSGRAGLTLDPVLSALAREHSLNMANMETLRHEWVGGSGLDARLRKHGYRAKTARENLARAGSARAAQEALYRSPGHRANLLATDISHVGIGVVRRRGPSATALYITQVFATPVELPTPEDLRTAYLDRIGALRRRLGLPSPTLDPVLQLHAGNNVGRLQIPLEKDSLERMLSEIAREYRHAEPWDLGSITLSVQVVGDIRDLEVQEILSRALARRIGAAAIEIPDSAGERRLVLLSFIGLTRSGL